MKRIIIKSLYDAFDYVMSHYYPYGLEEFAEKTDTYAVISFQDSHTGGFGITFAENDFCKGVLTLYVDDIFKEVEGLVLFGEDHAKQIIDFVDSHKDVDTLIVHCYAGQSRSVAAGAYLMEYFGVDNSEIFKTHSPNMHIYETLKKYVLSSSRKPQTENRLQQ